MKTQYIFLLFLFQYLQLAAQDHYPLTVHFSYDANGNSIHRWVTVEDVLLPDTTGLLNNLPFVKEVPAGAVETSQGEAMLYPNPTPGSLELKIPSAGERTPVEYGCYSLSGVELFRGKTTSDLTKIDISRYPPGSYFVILFQKERDFVWKVVRY